MRLLISNLFNASCIEFELNFAVVAQAWSCYIPTCSFSIIKLFPLCTNYHITDDPSFVVLCEESKHQ